MDERTAGRHLAGAELWVRAPADPARRRPAHPIFVAGWEDGEPFCATVCSTDVGLAFCRQCPEEVVAKSLETGRPSQGRCRAGVRLLAFPAPRGSRKTVAVLRVGPPTPRQAAAVAERTRVTPEALRRAARQAGRSDARGALAAARLLRTAEGLLFWQAQQRSRGSDRRRTATAALAQMIATSEEFHELYRASQRQRSEIERNQRRLDRLARQTLRASDRERARIAHQIHDTAAQSMVSAFRFLEAARTSMPGRASDTTPSQTDSYLESASDRLVAAIAEVRGVLASLLPPGLEELGLAHAIRRRMQELAAEVGLEVELTGDLPRMEAWVEQALYGVTAEAMTNAVRHARAKRLQVTLAEHRGRAVISVVDDGHGFDSEASSRSVRGHGLGLLGIARQTTWLGGRATIRSRPGAGCVVRISVPLARHRVVRSPQTPAEAASSDGSGATPGSERPPSSSMEARKGGRRPAASARPPGHGGVDGSDATGVAVDFVETASAVSSVPAHPGTQVPEPAQ